MKKSLIALAALAAVSAASAQSTLTITGGIATSVERTSVLGNKSTLTNFDDASNNITFAGTEDLGGGLKAGFMMNKRFNSADGKAKTAGREFEQSILTLESKSLGKVGFGRYQAVSFSSYDSMGNYQTGSDYGNNNTVGNRDDSSIFYMSPSFSGFKVTYSTTVNPSVNTGDEYSVVRFDYSNGPLNASVAYENNESLVNVASKKDKQVAASYDFGVAKAAVVWGKEGDAKGRTAFHLTVPVNAATKLMATVRNKGAGTDSAFALGAEYALSKRTVAFAQYGDTGVDTAQTAYRVGLRHSF